MTSAEVTFRHSENGARIRRARKLTGLSQEAFAPLIGTTRRHMIRLENGVHRPSGELRDRIVEASGTEEQIEASDDADEEADYVTVLFTRAREIALKRLAPTVIVALTLMVFASTAQASPPVPPMASRLTVLAQAVAGKPIVILIGPSQGGMTWVGGPVVMLDQQTYDEASTGQPLGLFILLHEVGHATGIADEGQADCFALKHFKWALRFFHLGKRAAQDRWLAALQVNRQHLTQRPYGCAA